jgi:Flp pilus assembly protein TadG
MRIGLRRREGGQELVELALVLPVLLLLLFAILEFGLVIFSYNAVSNVAREGARYGVAHPTDRVGIEATARAASRGLDPSHLSIAISYPGGNTIRVEARYDLTLFTGFVIQAVGGNPTMRLRSVSTMQIE